MCGSFLDSGRVCPKCGNTDDMTISIQVSNGATPGELYLPKYGDWLCEVCGAEWPSVEGKCEMDDDEDCEEMRG